METLGIYVLGLGGFGHHLPGFIRAYSDPGLFRRYRLRFTLVPLLLILACGLYSFLNLNALACATVAWGTWHGAMQINGFMRIYDSRVKSFQPVTAWLDWLMCLAWFGIAILHSPAKLFSLITQFYVSGGHLIPPVAFGIFRNIWDASTVLLTLLFTANAFRQWRAGSPPSPVKLLILVSSFAFWWYCMVTIDNLILGIVLWEIFHDVQYNALVWTFQRRRVDGNLNAGPVEKFLFMPGWRRLVLYSFLILAYGYIGVATSFVDLNMPEKILMQTGASQWLLRITLASAILHFYYDGFIWRIREQSIRRGLGFKDGDDRVPEPLSSEGFRHMWKWAIFIVPVVYLGIVQYRGWTAGFESQVLNLSEAIPGSWVADFLAGTYYKEQGLADRAEADFRKAVQYNPDFAIGHLFLGDLLYRKGDVRQAADHYRRSVELDPSDVVGRTHLAHLYLGNGQPVLAAGQFQAALALDSENPDLTFGMASSLLRLNRLPEAGIYAQKTLSLSPNHSGALNYLGMIRDLQGDLSGAIDYYQKSLAADSTNASARQNLADALRKTGSRDSRREF